MELEIYLCAYLKSSRDNNPKENGSSIFLSSYYILILSLYFKQKNEVNIISYIIYSQLGLTIKIHEFLDIFSIVFFASL
jgi:hypothetical protein